MSTPVYLGLDELVTLVPWGKAGIRGFMARGLLVEGVHWFRPAGPRSHLVFKWSAIQEFIEGPRPAPKSATPMDEREVRHVTDEVSRRLALG